MEEGQEKLFQEFDTIREQKKQIEEDMKTDKELFKNTEEKKETATLTKKQFVAKIGGWRKFRDFLTNHLKWFIPPPNDFTAEFGL